MLRWGSSCQLLAVLPSHPFILRSPPLHPRFEVIVPNHKRTLRGVLLQQQRRRQQWRQWQQWQQRQQFRLDRPLHGLPGRGVLHEARAAGPQGKGPWRRAAGEAEFQTFQTHAHAGGHTEHVIRCSFCCFVFSVFVLSTPSCATTVPLFDCETAATRSEPNGQSALYFFSTAMLKKNCDAALLPPIAWQHTQRCTNRTVANLPSRSS